MRLYSDTSEAFVDDVTNARIVPKISSSFREVFGWGPPDSELGAWRNSLEKVRNLIVAGRLSQKGVMLEYLLPASSRRLDCLISGRNLSGNQSAVILELKQWTRCKPSPLPSAVETRFKHGATDTLHPSVQVGQYQEYLLDFLTPFQGGDAIQLNSCAYLHNYTFESNDPLLDSKFRQWLEKFPIFCEGDFDHAKEFLLQKIGGGPGIDTLARVEAGTIRPSPDFIKHMEEVLSGKADYKLLDEQKLVYDRVLTSLDSALRENRKTAVIAKGGPGTGKTVIAVNLLAELIRRKASNVNLVTGSGAFTRTLRETIDSRVGRLFKFTNNYVDVGSDTYSALIVDEAHRIRSFSTNFYKQRTSREGDHQVDEILRAARVSVFFIDDNQAVTPEDVGRSAYIRGRAKKLDIPVHEYTLSIQFRCRGSDSFISWIDSALGLSSEPVPKWVNPPGFEFRIFDSLVELDKEILELSSSGKSARLTAGFCWKWSQPNPDGTLPRDVAVDGLQKPWNAKEGRSRKTRLAPGIPPAQLWATAAGGENQIGCVYTAQGFEFDTVGVIFGNDLAYDPEKGAWNGIPGNSRDPKLRHSGRDFERLIKQSYRVLLSRGISRCYVYFVDKATRQYFESRIMSVGTSTDPPKAAA